MQFAISLLSRAAIVLLFAGKAAQAAGDQPQVSVLVYNNANVSANVMRGAQGETARIFAIAGIHLGWVNCLGKNEPASCSQSPEPDELVLHVIPAPKGQVLEDSVYGEAFPAEDGMSTYADVFFRRIETAQSVGILNGDLPSLLGAVIAHEIGHLLLGPHAHSWVGIMTPQWSKEILQKQAMGMLHFNRDQAESMREKIRIRTLDASQVAKTSASVTPNDGPLRCRRWQPAGMPALPRLQPVMNCERPEVSRPSAGEESIAPQL
jgi:hypothetical protein